MRNNVEKNDDNHNNSNHNHTNNNSVIVAKLHDKAPYPYTALASSPYGRLIVIAGKDNLRFVSIKASGLKEVKSIRISQFFQETRSIGLAANNTKQASNKHANQDLNNVFSNSAVGQNTTATNIVIKITDIAWSLRQFDNDDEIDTLSKKTGSKSNDPIELPSPTTTGVGDETPGGADMKKDPLQSIISMPDDLLMADDSLIAVAGSNGVIVIWRTCDILGGGFGNNRTYDNGPSNMFGGGATKKQNDHSDQAMNHFLFIQHYMNNQAGGNRRPETAIGQPEAILVEHTRAVNRIAWHRRRPGVLLTASQDTTVKIFERRETKTEDDLFNQKRGHESSKWKWFSRAESSSSVKSYSWHYIGCFKPNCGPISDIQWSPCNDDLFALVTENGFLVVHAMQLVQNGQLVNNGRPMVRISAHGREASTLDWHPTEPYIIATGSVDKTVKVWDLESGISSYYESNANNIRHNSQSLRSHGSFDSSSFVSGETSPVSSVYEQDPLSHSFHGGGGASWSNNGGGTSPHYNPTFASTLMKPGASSRHHKNAAFTELYELSVAAQVEKLRWRPPNKNFADRFISGSDAVADHHGAMLAIATSPASGAASGRHGTVSLWSYHRPFMPLSIVEGHKDGAVTDFLWLDSPEIEEEEGYILPAYDDGKISSLAGTWQHVLSIGKDGRCIVQSFARGERPLSNVAPSAFAITNLSPFQTGFGSLQLISAHQKVPSGQNNDYMLCGLRRDEVTALAPGFFKEDLPSDDLHAVNKFQWNPRKEPSESVRLNFSVTDSGDLDELFLGSSKTSMSQNEVKIAPEVVHLSRFAEAYKLHSDSSLQTKAAVCRHNASVAKSLQCEGHSRMWNILATMLEGSDIEGNYGKSKNQVIQNNAMSFILYPTLKTLLLERADAGDVQTCVVLCEVMEVVRKQKNNTITIVVPGLDLLLVRQWYFSYIEILQQMCLFSHAAFLIGNCKDPEIGKLNQTSTTIHTSCPMCLKPLQSGKKSCKTCRRKIGLCFLCHEPVTGIFVLCPGCGHGGHLEHALEWFTSLDNPFHELCPTGCGHKCNLITLPRASHFPRTESLNHLQAFDTQ